MLYGEDILIASDRTLVTAGRKGFFQQLVLVHSMRLLDSYRDTISESLGPPYSIVVASWNGFETSVRIAYLSADGYT